MGYLGRHETGVGCGVVVLGGALSLAGCADSKGMNAEGGGNKPSSMAAKPPPNIVVILAGDLGFGGLGAYATRFGTLAPAPTPRMDALAAEGMLFTQAHSANGVCTPSRYSLLTGKYNFRTSRTSAGISPLPTFRAAT